MRLYTKTGDAGDTGLFGGQRVSKADMRVEAYGTVDELNALLGVVVATLRASGGVPGAAHSRADELEWIQADLFRLGAELATPNARPGAIPGAPVSEADIVRLEGWIDARDAECAPLRTFILPGGARTAASLHHARTVARRAERRVVRLCDDTDLRGEIVRYLNRLSDLLFAYARAENARLGVTETPWKP